MPMNDEKFKADCEKTIRRILREAQEFFQLDPVRLSDLEKGLRELVDLGVAVRDPDVDLEAFAMGYFTALKRTTGVN